MAALTALQHQTLMANPWFSSLPDRVRQDIVAHSGTRAFDRGERILSRGDPGTAFYAILDGVVQVSGTSLIGRMAVLTFYLPGAWFGEISLLDGKPRTHDVGAHTDLLLLALGAANFELLLATHAEFSRSLLRLECERLRAMSVAMESTATHSPEQRLAGRLVELARNYGSPTAKGLRIDMNLPQETLACLIGISRQRINQIFKHWVDDGLIEQHYGHLILRDDAAMEALASGGY